MTKEFRRPQTASCQHFDGAALALDKEESCLKRSESADSGGAPIAVQGSERSDKWRCSMAIT